MNKIYYISIILIAALGMTVSQAYAVDSQFDVYLTDFYEDNNYKACLTEEGILPTPDDCIEHTGRELAAGQIPYFIAQGSEVGFRIVISVEDTTNKTIVYKLLDDMPANPEELLLSMNDSQSGTTRFASEETQQTETQTETVTTTETVETDEEVEDEADEESEVNPYCDKFEGVDDWPDSGCWDRKDYDDGGPNNGLYPCNDGTYKKDWRDCKDVSGYDYDDDDSRDEEEDTGGSNPEGEEEDQSCGGESCSDDEKEDPTTDEDVPPFG